MREPVEVLALRKEVLIARSTLCRLKIRRDAAAVRGTLSPARSGMALAGAAPVRELGLGLRSPVGWRTGGALVALASRAVILARVALAAFVSFARRNARGRPRPRRLRSASTSGESFFGFPELQMAALRRAPIGREEPCRSAGGA